MSEMNSTYNYHKNTPIDLRKEFTICESFSSPSSPYAIMLGEPMAYGAMAGDFLREHNLLRKGSTIVETGGGYGSLMHGLLSAHGDLIRKVFMVDLSQGLLHRQRKRLMPWQDRICCIRGDIHDLVPAITGVDLIIANEVIGDLDTLCGIEAHNLPQQARDLVETYSLEIPGQGLFNLNYGAIRLVEALCEKGIPAFITEHSCDPVIPGGMEYLKRDLKLDSFPRRIDLYKHSEFTIRFSHLIKVAQAFGRKTMSGSLIDLIDLKKSRALKTIFTIRACGTEKQEIIYEMLDHIREYRWLIISP